MLRLPDSWAWDAWYVQDEDTYHAFFLYASRALHDPERRHERASVGHAVSTDLRTWERVEDALVRGMPGEFVDVATWTGSVVRGDDGRWHLFYTGVTRGPGESLTQRVGLATSDDLHSWHRHSANPVLRPDPLLYGDEHWRDPWVMRDPDDRGSAVTGGITLIVLALLPLLAARGLLKRRSWSRGPAVITQIMALPVAYNLLQADSVAIPAGIALAVVAVASLFLLVNSDTTRALGIKGPGRSG